MSWIRVESSTGSVVRFAFLALIAFGAFAYSGPAQPLVRALAVVLVAGNAAEGVLGQRSKQPTHTELVVETYPAKLLKYYGTRADQLRERWEREGRSVEQWRFIFFGPPGTQDTIVWSARHKNMFPDDKLIFDQIWRRMFNERGGEVEDESEQDESKLEPHLVFEVSPRLERGLLHRGGVYRMYLNPWPRLHGPDEPKIEPTVLAYLPVALLMDNLKEKDRGEIAALFDLREVKQVTDTIEDAFGDLDIYHPEGGPYRVYENDLFKFKVMHHWSQA